MSLLAEVQQARSAHQASLLARPNVIGLGVGYKVSGNQFTG